MSPNLKIDYWAIGVFTKSRVRYFHTLSIVKKKEHEMSQEMTEVVVFRGRSTDRILADARLAGLITKHTIVTIVCLDSDRLSKQGDVQVSTYQPYVRSKNLTLIVNGGTSAQLAPVLLHASRAVQADYYESRGYMEWHSEHPGNYSDPEGITLRVVDLQPDGMREIH